MASLSNSAEGGSNTTLVSAANSGGSSGDAWSSVSRGSAASSYTFSSSFPAHGTLGYAIQAASGEACQLIWTYVGGSGAACLFYYKHPGTPTAAAQIAQIRNAGGNAAIMSIGTDNKLVLQNATGTDVRKSPTALVANDEVWISFRALKGASTALGTVEYAWGYKGSATVVDTGSSSTTNAGTADMTSTRIGRTNAVAWAATSYFDSIECETSFSVLIPSREQRNLTGSLTPSGEGTSSAAGVPSLPGALAPSGSGTNVATGVPAIAGALTPSGSGTNVVTGVPRVTGSLAPSGSGTAALAGVPAIAGSLGPSGTGTTDLTYVPALWSELYATGEGTCVVDGEASNPDEPPPNIPLPHALSMAGAARTLTVTSDVRGLTVTSTVRTLSIEEHP